MAIQQVSDTGGQGKRIKIYSRTGNVIPAAFSFLYFQGF
jgi:hypothetical protein